MSRPLAALVDDLFHDVARGCPEASAAIAARCAGLGLTVAVGAERFGIAVGPRGPRLCEVTEAGARVEASLLTIRALILGEDDVDPAARAGRLGVYGSAEALVMMDDLVRLLVAGAARVPETGRILDEFLSMTQRGARG